METTLKPLTSGGDAPRASLLGSIEELSEEEVDRLLAGDDPEMF